MQYVCIYWTKLSMMKQKCVFLFSLCMICISSHCQVFATMTEEGVKMTFKVISSANKYVQVGVGDSYSPAIDTHTEGVVSIPATVVYNKQEYVVKSIADYAFYLCSELVSIHIPSRVNTIGNRSFLGCKSLLYIEIPNGVTSIGRFAFRDCSGLMSAQIASSVTMIGREAFANCEDLQRIMIGTGVRHIDVGAFSGCKNLKDFYCYSTTIPTLDEGVFTNSKIDNVTLHVPAESILLYKTKSPWSSFKRFVIATKEENDIEDNEIYQVVDEKAEFPGGRKELRKYLREKIIYPYSVKNGLISGLVVVEFAVNKNGSISDVKVIKSVSRDCDAEAVRLVKAMPKWKPGEVQGKVVRSMYTLSIGFWQMKETVGSGYLNRYYE